MNSATLSVLLVLLTIVFFGQNAAELITAGVLLGSAVLGGGGWYKWDKLKDLTYCRLSECCNDDYVPFNLDVLNQSLSEKMFGQPLVNELVNILGAHKNMVESESISNRKALVISLHGWAGVGKNYAASIIAEALYKKGLNSKYVKIMMGKKDFDCSDLEKSQRELIKTVNSVVQSCGKALIILDEIHDMCPSVLDAIKPMFDHHHEVDGVDYRDTIFIFISNIGGQEIATSLLQLYDQGYKRNDVEFNNFEPIIRKVAFYTGGFEKSSTIAHHLVDHYVPFLPLELAHVEMCARAEFRAHGVTDPTSDMMTDALSVITYGPKDRPIFANNGCKRFTRHIPYVIQKHKQKG